LGKLNLHCLAPYIKQGHELGKMVVGEWLLGEKIKNMFRGKHEKGAKEKGFCTTYVREINLEVGGRGIR